MLVKEFLCSRNDVSLDRNSSRLPHITFICCSEVYTQLNRMCQTTKTKNDVSSYEPNFGTNSMRALRKRTACSVLGWRIVLISLLERNSEYFDGIRIDISRFFLRYVRKVILRFCVKNNTTHDMKLKACRYWIIFIMNQE